MGGKALKGCELLTMSSDVHRRIASSSDTLCELLERNCTRVDRASNSTRVDTIMRHQNFGSRWQSDELVSWPPKLSKVWLAATGMASAAWAYRDELQLLQPRPGYR